jgi:large subunit ribosomal protein L30
MNEPEKKVEKKERAEKKPSEKAKQIAIVRIRGSIRINKEIKDTLNMLRLYKRNYCIIVLSTQSILGMLQRVKDYITWGEINDETLKLLKDKRLEKTKDKKGKEVEKKFFRLNPPRGGFERKGTKVAFKVGGALGNRGNKINDLIKRMV